MSDFIIRLIALLLIGIRLSSSVTQEEICEALEDDATACDATDGCQVPDTNEGCEVIYDVIVGDTCYCTNNSNLTNLTFPVQTTRRRTMTMLFNDINERKRKLERRKKNSNRRRRRRLGKTKKTKKSKGDSTYGFGDCECDKDYGMTEIRMIYQGSVDGVDIQFTTKDDDDICSFSDVDFGDELTCSLTLSSFTDSDGDIIEKFTTNTYFTIDGGNEICEGSIHTSCSKDIVGTTSEDCEELFVTGWKDGNDDGNNCDDGFYECDCDSGNPFTMECDSTTCDEDPETDVTVIRGNGVCYCSNIGNFTTTAYVSTFIPTSQPTPEPTEDEGEDEGEPGRRRNRRRLGKTKKSKKSKKSKGDGNGYGDCECDGGMSMLRMVYIGTASEAKRITMYYGALDGVKLCVFNNTGAGDEIQCTLTDQVDNDGDPIEKFKTNTYLRVEYEDGSISDCEGSVHTSCSRDIVGYTAEGCDDIVVTGWDDNDTNDSECDDGYDICECPCSVWDDEDACLGYSECCWDDTEGECYDDDGSCTTGTGGSNMNGLSVVFIFVNVYFVFLWQ